MKNRLAKYLIFILLASAQVAFAQKQEKIFYDKTWKACSQSEAEYYRLITFDEKGKPVGKVKDYYSTGELQGEEEFSYFDKNDDSKSVLEGTVIWYYKNGKKSQESNFVSDQKEGLSTLWFENGKIDREIEYKNGKLSGKWIQYYETGELKGKGVYLYIDKNDSSKRVLNGIIWFYKNGKKLQEMSIVSGQEEGLTTNWFENGNKEKETEHKNGKLSGKWIEYYDTGKIKRQIIYKDGLPIDKWGLECDEFDNCQKVFYEVFNDKENINKWPLMHNDSCISEIIPKKGLRMETTGNRGFAQLVHLPIDITSDFSFETSIAFNSGEKNSGHGLIWGFKDWDNYYYFDISANGYYRIGAISDGLNLEFKKWETFEYINKNEASNLIKVKKIKDKVYFSINGQIIESEDFYSFKGNKIGFHITSGKKEVLFKNLLIRQDLEGDESITQIPSTSNWKGNGTGFFIDSRGYIATNYHVIESASVIEVDFIQNGQKKMFKAKIISSDKQNDLSIIKIDDTNFKAFTKLPYSFKTQISDVGSNVFVLGYPMALTVMGDEVKFTDGKISAKTGFKGDVTSYQVSVPIQPGNSGGPLFDYSGNIIGIVNAKIMAAENVSYAIKSSYLKNLLDVLPEDIDIPHDQALSSKSLTEKIKLLSDYVVLIKIK